MLKKLEKAFDGSKIKWFEEILIYRQQSFLRRQESSRGL